jgi:hemolysin D
MKRLFALLRNDENSRRRNRVELEFLPAALEILETPPSPRKGAVLLVCCSIVGAGLLCSWFGHVDIVAVAQGRVVPGHRALAVRALHDGTIEQVFCEEGGLVEQGARLLSMEANETETDLRQLEQQILQAEEAAMVLRKELQLLADGELKTPDAVPGLVTDSGKALASGLYGARFGLEARKREAEHDLVRLDTDREVKRAGLIMAQKLLPLQRELHARAMRVAGQDYDSLSRTDVLQALEALTRTETLETQSRQEFEGLAAQRLAVVARMEVAFSEHQQDLGLRLVEQTQILEEGRISLKRLRKRFEETFICAPISGIVHQQSVRSAGAVVRGGETLMTLIPGKENLEIEAFASNLDSGWLRTGQSARIKVESFPFTKHGTLSGRIRRIAADAVEDPKTKALVFPVIVELEPKKSPPALLASLAPGMSCSAEIHIEKQRLLEVWLSPLRRTVNESFRER